MAESGSGVARLRVLDTPALALSRLLPRCSRRMCRTTAVALNACWRNTEREKSRMRKKVEVEGLFVLLSQLISMSEGNRPVIF